mmetsp:Transcript_43715/g.93580  ORF Transcript_43715/g.93580 Transcript_43715/m.93580 type:complete len:357 (+) Transcript_43715:114-1184(+)
MAAGTIGCAGRSAWFEPGGESDSSNPQLPVPSTVQVLPLPPISSNCKVEGLEDAILKNRVASAEIEWMMEQRRLELDLKQLKVDYGEEEAAEIVKEASACGLLTDASTASCKGPAGALAWPGVGTRWRRFVAWWSSLAEVERPTDARGALQGFADALGRVRTFRALALDKDGLELIAQKDEIFPSGRLRPGINASTLQDIINTHGVTKVAVMRLFISHIDKIGGIDPSISLHDDWQTTSIIASGYARGGKRVHLFEVSVPAVESLGLTLQEVAHRSGPYLGPRYADHDRWFLFPSPAVPEGTWFDATLQRTERYGLYSIPFLQQRLQQLFRFASKEEPCSIFHVVLSCHVLSRLVI